MQMRKYTPYLCSKAPFTQNLIATTTTFDTQQKYDANKISVKKPPNKHQTNQPNTQKQPDLQQNNALITFNYSNSPNFVLTCTYTEFDTRF